MVKNVKKIDNRIQTIRTFSEFTVELSAYRNLTLQLNYREIPTSEPSTSGLFCRSLCFYENRDYRFMATTGSHKQTLHALLH